MADGNASEERPAEAEGRSLEESFAVVGVGASAGGLKAFETFFRQMPADCGMAFVLVQHLDPNHESELADLLQNHTDMPVAQVEDGTEVRPNHVYTIPPGTSLSLDGRTLHLSEPEHPHGHRSPIDHFLRSLAEAQREQAVCVILSGTGSDGAVGLRSIKEYGGLVLVQAPSDAEYDGMPRSAIGTGMVDLQAPASELPDRLVAYRKTADHIDLPSDADALPEDESAALRQLFSVLRTRTGHDFAGYKRSTILRRIRRRMQVNRKEDISTYLDLLRSDDGEAAALFKDFLISVTNFFRDAEAFATLEEEVIPALFEDKRHDDQVRVWVPGCATGEEAYSLAILLCEEAYRHDDPPAIQVFASDLDEDALTFARQGLYPEAVAADLSPERLDRYFVKEGSGYRVKTELQDVVLFADHNLIGDPPFSKLDLVSCRNLLIYLDRDVQARIFELFHYALRTHGYLFLGGAETADSVTELFEPVHKPHRIYRRLASTRSTPQMLTLPRDGDPLDEDASSDGEEDTHAADLGAIHREQVFKRYAPPSVIVDAQYQIRHLFGEVHRYLHRLEGAPSDDILENVGDELRVELRTALFQLFHNDRSVEPRRVRFQADGETAFVRLSVERIEHDEVPDTLALVVFEPVETLRAEGADDEPDDRTETVVAQLEDELKHTKYRLQTVIEEYETSNEELKASNEELQSMNEELRSTTEELETSKEELQSTNEELTTLNNELKAKVEQVNRANSDLRNLMASTDIATIFLDRDLQLKRYTPRATDLFNLIPADTGRPFGHVSHRIDHEDLAGLAEQVLDRLQTVEQEIESRDGRWYLMRMLPYRTVEDKIDGVVTTFVDVTDRREAEMRAERRAQQQAVVAAIGQYALRESSIENIMARTVRAVAGELDAPLCKVLELRRDRDDLLLRAGIGWQDDVAGTAIVSTGVDSQAGYTLNSDAPVVVEDLETERRFEGPPLLLDHAVRSGISVVIQGTSGPYGVLGVHATEPHYFDAQDAHFLQAVANVLGAAVERHEAEQALRTNEQRYRQALQNSPITFARIDEDLRYEWVFNIHPDFGADVVIGKRDDELDEGPGIDAMMALKQRVLDRGEQEREEITFERSDGSRTYDVTATPLRDEDGRLHGLITASLDVTERKAVEVALQEQKLLLQSILEQMPSGISVAEAPAGRLVLHNEEAIRLLRHPMLPSDDYTGYAQYGALHPDGTPYAPEEYPIARALKGGVVHQEEMRYHRGDDTVTTFSVNAAPIRDQDGQIVRAVSTFQDISRIKRYERDLRALNEQLEERVRLRTRQVRRLASELTLAEQRERHRIAQILHDDLQQLIYSAQLKLSIVSAELSSLETPHPAALLDQMRRVLQEALSVTRNLTVNMSPPVLKGEGLAESIQWLATHVREDYDLDVDVQAEATVELPPGGMRVLLFQLVRELLFNVVKHAETDRAVVTLGQADDHVYLRVTDQGAGFEPSLLTDPAHTSQGFGLTTMRERLDLFDGTLHVETQPGAGTAITIVVPISSVGSVAGPPTS